MSRNSARLDDCLRATSGGRSLSGGDLGLVSVPHHALCALRPGRPGPGVVRPERPYLARRPRRCRAASAQGDRAGPVVPGGPAGAAPRGRLAHRRVGLRGGRIARPRDLAPGQGRPTRRSLGGISPYRCWPSACAWPPPPWRSSFVAGRRRTRSSGRPSWAQLDSGGRPRPTRSSSSRLWARKWAVLAARIRAMLRFSGSDFRRVADVRGTDAIRTPDRVGTVCVHRTLPNSWKGEGVGPTGLRCHGAGAAQDMAGHRAYRV